MEQNVRTTSRGEPLWTNYIHRKGAKLGLPISGTFELTSNCNFNCKMCYVHTPNHKEALTADEWIKIGEQARDRGMVFLLLTGGEPFLRPDFKKIYGALSEMGLMISINTNASLIDDEMFAFLLRHPPTRMNISLYACNDEAYAKLCGKAACDIVKKNIVQLHDAGISVKINSTITPYNYSEIESIYAFAAEVGVPVTATTYMYPPVRVNDGQFGVSPARFQADEAAFYLLKCREQYLTPEQLQSRAAIDMPEDEMCGGDTQENMRCRAGKTAFWITWDGRMLPCGMFPHEGYSVPQNGFDAAWEQVRAFVKTIMLPKECTNCSGKDHCPVCAAACIAETGESSVRPKYICEMTRAYNKLLREKYQKQTDRRSGENEN